MVICESLEKKGLIRRETVETDRRSYRLSATESGLAAIKIAMPVAASTYGPLLAALTEEDQAILTPILEKLRAAMAALEV
jgi:DNA-binding MarR family transcriptional regulator